MKRYDKTFIKIYYEEYHNGMFWPMIEDLFFGYSKDSIRDWYL